MNSVTRARDFILLTLVTFAAILVHGYHPAVEDASIYLPGIKKMLDPSLFPYNAAFFTSHAHMTFFPNLVTLFVRATHLPLDWALLVLHLLSIFFLLFGCLRLGRFVFRSSVAPWGGVALVAALLTIPVAGTALYIFDEYLNPRSISVPALLFLVVAAYERRWVMCGALAIFAAAIHPLMAAFGIAYVLLSLLLAQFRTSTSSPTSASAARAFTLLLPFGLSQPMTDAYRKILQGNTYFSVLNWEWYEWLGALAPPLLLWWFHRIGEKTSRPGLDRVGRDLAVFGSIFTIAALVINIPQRFSSLMLLQPMRAFHLIYIAFFVISGGLLADYVLKNKTWRWLLLFLPLCGGMWFKQQQIFSSTQHLELPGRAPSGDWEEAFLWIRQNTPKDAYFALDPQYMNLPGEDQHGFRALAERSMLADSVKDRSAMSMFPQMAETWKQQADAERDWQHFGWSDFQRLKAQFGVDWVVLRRPVNSGMTCPHENPTLLICRVE
jgi:hypothetical protein